MPSAIAELDMNTEALGTEFPFTIGAFLKSEPCAWYLDNGDVIGLVKL